ncbi:MAG TPA: c-type cytochrome [Planctomycetota bacterium]|nr:c-type cytochrome [Planctomycetota bacterium]
MRFLSAFVAVALIGSSLTAADAPVDRDNKPIPAPAELAKLTGDAAKGQASFAPLCGICHQVNGVGIDFGPNLSEVGSRKTKELIAESILDPSKVIEPGFEAVMIKLESDETAMGIVAAETDTEVTVKAMGGAKTTFKKADIVSRTKQPMSMMPVGLYRALSTEDLVNVVEFLSQQKKK